MRRRFWISIAVLTFVVYAAAIWLGLHARRLDWLDPASRLNTFLRQTPTWRDAPAGKSGDDIRMGALLFNETPIYAQSHVKARLSCASCHAEGGLQPFASPMIGVPETFPQYNARAGRVISLDDRIQECFVRSENGTPISPAGDEMRQLKAYIDWISQKKDRRHSFEGRGLVRLPDLTPDPVRGASIYAAQCAGCHGENGKGKHLLAPPLWGSESFTDGAGMHGVKKMAAFVQHNMPQNRMGVLTPQDAYDVAGYIHQQERPAFNTTYARY